MPMNTWCDPLALRRDDTWSGAQPPARRTAATAPAPLAASPAPAAAAAESTAIGSGEPRELELLRLHFTLQQALGRTYAVWIIGLFVALATLRHTTAPEVTVWLAVLLLAFTLRARWLRPALALERLRADPARWQRRFALSTLGCALVVAVGPWLLFPLVPERTCTYVTMILCCWLSGAMGSLGYYPLVYGGYASLFALGLVAGWARMDSPFVLEIGVMLAVYVLIAHGFCQGFARQVRQSIGIRQTNERLLDELRVAKEKAEASSLAKSRFLAVASHDLRQPLHALSLLNGLLSRPLAPERAREISAQMGRALNTLERLFSSVLDLSRLEADTVQPRLQWLPLDTLIARVVDDFGAQARASGLSLSHTCPNLLVHTDPDLFERVLRNLVENALKFTREGGVAIGVTAGADGSQVVTVADSGVGISAHLRDDIFKEYFQAEGSRARGGLGLGLAIVKRLSVLLGIEVALRENVPAGACFELRFPARAWRPAMADGGEPAPPPEDEDIDLDGLRVLCVDDDPQSLQALLALLSDWGCQVVGARSPAQALALARRQPDIQVVLSDYALDDELDGESLIHALRGVLGEVPGALLTGDARAVREHQAGRIEFPVLPKPVASAELRQLLEVFRAID